METLCQKCKKVAGHHAHVGDKLVMANWQTGKTDRLVRQIWSL